MDDYFQTVLAGYRSETNLEDSMLCIERRRSGANGFRLLSDAEWQYTCKAGTTGYRYESIDQIAWYQDNSSGSVHPVGERLPNPWGRYGNYRIFRGGSWAEVENNCGSIKPAEMK